jgi:hypothetical protein
MNAFALKYGNHSITLAQSKQLIGVKLKQNKADDAREAVQRSLPDSSWKSEGTLGGFRLVSICDCSVDADQALDRIRRDASVLVGTHVFELSEGRGIFVPTGELFVGFKTGTSAELKQRVITEFGLKIKDTRGREGFFLVVTPQSPNPVKVATSLQQRPFVSVAEPDLASKGVIKVLRLSSGLSAEKWHRRSVGYQGSSKFQGGHTIDLMGGSGRNINNVVLRQAAAQPEPAMALRWHFSRARRESNAELLPKPEPVPLCQVDVPADAVPKLAVPKLHAGREDDGARRAPAPAVTSVVSAPLGKDEPPPGGGPVPMIEIVIGAATIRVPPGADLATLQAVLRAVRSMA